MFGVILFLLFLVMGYLYFDMAFKKLDIFTKLWGGGIFGVLALMFGIIPFAALFQFTVAAHIALTIAFCLPYLLIRFVFKPKKEEAKPLEVQKGKKNPAAAKTIEAPLEEDKNPLNLKVFCMAVIPIFLIIAMLMFNHIMYPGEDGSVTSGQSTYGDLAMHMGFVTSFAEQHTFPPTYNLLPGVKLSYPFLIDSLSSSLYLFGTGLRLSILLPSFVFAFLLVLGFYIFAYTLTKKRSVSILSSVFFFLNGGFGFSYFFDGSKANPANFTRIFTEFYKTPTNLNEMNIRWANTICDMIVPQRTTMAGWTVILFALWLLYKAVTEKKMSLFVIMGLVAGAMPMVHTHSFFAFGIICAALFVTTILTEEDKAGILVKWLVFGGITAVMALPQLIVWTFGQTANEGFLQSTFSRYKGFFFWLNKNDPEWWFWLKNWGVIALFALPAALNTSKLNKKFAVGCAVIFAIAQILLFQPNEYDNNKLFFVVFMFAVIFTSEFFVKMFNMMKSLGDKYLFGYLKGMPGQYFIAAVFIFFATVSGVLTIGREYKSGGEYLTFDKNDFAICEFVRENTNPDEIFITADWHINPVVCLAGRNTFVGAGVFLGPHGYNSERVRRSAIVKSIYEAADVTTLKNIANTNKISYIYYGPHEQNAFKINEDVFKQLRVLYNSGNKVVFALK